MIVHIYTGNRELKQGSLESGAPPILLTVVIQSGQRVSALQ